jgi:hypothetical protein
MNSGVLLLGHDLNGWWTGSQLTIEETRALVPHQNATTLQVAESVIGGVGFVGSYLMYNYVINFVPAGLAGVTLNLIPMFGVLTAVVFLDEHLTVWYVVGGVAVISGITLFPTQQPGGQSTDSILVGARRSPVKSGRRLR